MCGCRSQECFDQSNTPGTYEDTSWRYRDILSTFTSAPSQALLISGVLCDQAE